MRRVCLTLPTNRACAETITAVAEEAAYGARRFDAEVHLLVLDSSDAPVLAEHRRAVAALPAVEGVVVHHLDEAEQRAFLRQVITRSGAPEPDRVLDLMLPSGVSYGACTNRAFLFAEALGCTSVHRRDSDSRYQSLDGETVFPLHHELAHLGRPAADVAGQVTKSRLAPAFAQRPVAMVGASFVGEMSVDVEEIRRLDPGIYHEIIGLSVPAGYADLWRDNLVEQSFRGAGTTPFTADHTTLTHVSPLRVDMCNIAFGNEVYGRVPLPPATDTIGSDYFLVHLVDGARLPGVLHNRHIVNYHTGERRSDSGFLAYQVRIAKYLLATRYFNEVYARMAAAGEALLDDRGGVDAAAVAGFVRDGARLDRTEDAERLDLLDRSYRKLGGRYTAVADELAARRARLLHAARADMADFALLVDVWERLMRTSAVTGFPYVRPAADPSGRPSGTRTRTLTVAYAGGEARRGPVTMGQANMIRCILRDDPAHINIHDVWPVPAGTTLDAAVDALRTLVVRHEALRTTFPDASAAADGEQVVAAEGTFTVTVLDHEELPRDAAGYAESLARRARSGRFRLDREFPLRTSLVARDGAPVFVALVSSHAAADGSALAVLREEWLALLDGADLPPLTGLTPLELAAEEAAPAGLRKSEASLAYWETILRTGPQAMFAEPRATGTDIRMPQLTLRSARGGRALGRIVERTGSLPSTVLLTAWCALVAHRAGQSTCVTAVPTSNRFRTRLARSVTTLSQDALLALDVTAPSFDALLRKTWGAALNAYRHSRFDSVGLWEMIGRVTFERGSLFARDVVFNDVSTLASTPASTTPQADDEDGPELSWGPDQVLPTRVLAFAYQTTPLLHLALWADPALFPRQEAEGFLTGLVRLLEAAADADVPLASLTAVTGVRAVERGPDWERVDGSWVSPSAVAGALGRALGGVPVHVAADVPDPDGADPDRAGPGLTAFIAAADAALTPAAAHAALMDALPGRPGVLAPRRYVIVREPPAQADRSDAWLRQQILSEGNGRERRMSHDDG
ncbi:hypothetical protein GCM10010371_22520 [Streptomyces subrutilus]|uniref:Condensation domain-containing protein n=2 Tax=Streptomyces subrutilus TaxID=36818 RepID=A0A918V2X2_9ACTN|nr:hypothetical protein GCM10010371_22520 [Streptomyces subrutilus]